VTASDESTALAAAIATDVQVLVARIATLKADVDALSILAQGVAVAVDAARPIPTAGNLGALVRVGPAPEAE
jgi:outer membrane murein-binding lipoprotein Lpp